MTSKRAEENVILGRASRWARWIGAAIGLRRVRRDLAADGTPVSASAAAEAVVLAAEVGATAHSKHQAADSRAQLSAMTHAAVANIRTAESDWNAAVRRLAKLQPGSLGLVVLLVGCCLLFTAVVGVSMGLLLYDAVAGWMEVPVAAHVALQIAAVADEFAETLGLNPEQTQAFVAQVAAQATGWQPQAVHRTSMLIAMGLALGVTGSETFAQLAVPKGWLTKLLLVLANVAMACGYYWLRAGGLTTLHVQALAISTFELAVLLANLVVSVRVSGAIHEQCSRVIEYRRAQREAQLGEMLLAAARAGWTELGQAAQTLAQWSDQLEACSTLDAEPIAAVMKTRGILEVEAKRVEAERLHVQRIERCFLEETIYGKFN